MDFIYLLLNGHDWEDIIIILVKEDAIEKSKKYPNQRVEIFNKNENNEYIPTYNYYINGIYIEKS